ncbi:CotH kinase family protein [Fibrobacter sp. UWH4]|uniref:CotH kinase family protein n=1 Tax=Fibrobacter sp. UWH4 TaxID=1896210 RepID=UPI00091F18FB|nr:CotH kinase family protein [Fibrobacter sp. UWH4]SHK54057.1 CotH protein [Fibrobacter sp. UWH4]
MGYWAKVISATALLASFSLAQTYDLPIVFIDTKGECLDQNVTEKIPATMKVLDGATNNVADSAKGTRYDIGIKVRGQSSAKFPKPGYSIEVRDEKGEGMDVSLFGLPPGDDWVLHGPYVDKSMMRNALAHWLFRQAGHYSPRTRHFDLYINGVYRGVYVLIEKIKRGKYRVNVSKLKETDISGDDVTGGYIWAFDKTGTNTGGMGMEDINKEGFSTADGLNVIMHYPKKENLQTQQQAYLKKYLEDLENLFKNGKNGSGYENYVDMTSALDYVLHEEVTNNSDSYWCSFFLHKPKDSKGGKVTLGPAWDFNLAMSNGGGMGSTTTDGWQIENPQKQGQGGMMMMGGGLKAPNWLIGMWKDSHYQSELKKRWAELRSGVWHTKTMDAYLDSMKLYITKAADRNFKRWPNLGQGSGQGDPDPEPMKYCNNQNQGGQNQNPWGMWGGGMGGGITMGGNNASTWDGEFEHLRKKMKERMQWMDQQLGFTEPSQPIVTEPVIHDPDWQKDTITQSNYRNVQMENLSRLSPTNYFAVNGDHLEIQTSLGGMFALVDLNGTVLYKTRIGKGLTTLKVPAKAMNRHWIATLNGKMLSR